MTKPKDKGLHDSHVKRFEAESKKTFKDIVRTIVDDRKAQADAEMGAASDPYRYQLLQLTERNSALRGLVHDFSDALATENNNEISIARANLDAALKDSVTSYVDRLSLINAAERLGSAGRRDTMQSVIRGQIAARHEGRDSIART